MNAYAHWVHQWPLLSAALQFALLGTLGEVLAGWLATRRLPFPLAWLPAKMLAWAVLGVVIKLGFVMMKGAKRGAGIACSFREIKYMLSTIKIRA